MTVHRIRRTKRNRRGRRGIATLAFIILLGVAAVFATGWLSSAVAARRAAALAEQRLQTEWLVAAGIERAAARLAADPKYADESWSISGEELGLQRSAHLNAKIEILIVNDSDRPGARLVGVVAKLRDGEQTLVSKSVDTYLEITAQESSP